MATLAGHGPTPGDLKGAIDGGKYLWVAPTYKQIENSDIWKDMKRACIDAVHHPDDIREGDREIRLANGASIRVMSADGEDSLRGPGLDGLVIDEASRVSARVWHEVLRPALADKRGWCMFLTTPNGKNWFHKLFTEAKAWPDWECWQLPTSENPIVSPEELESIRNSPGLSPRIFAQEHLANFMDIEGARFPSDYFEDHVWADQWPDKFVLSAIAVDSSMGDGDPSAIVFAGLCGDLLYVEADIKVRPPEEIVADTVQMFQRLQPDIVAVEAIGFQSLFLPNIARYCHERGVPSIPLHGIESHQKNDGGKVGRIVARLDYHFAKHLVRFRRRPGCEVMLEQLQMLGDKTFNDDGPDALEMAIRVMNLVAGVQQ